MFLGTRTERIPLWSQRWVDSPFGRGGRIEFYRAGTQDRLLHRYECEKCGRLVEVIGEATEPFFCNCNRLISLDDVS